jgi:hypothetical protein
METVKHYFLYCSRFVAQREQLLSLPAWLLHPMWMNLSENRKIEILLHESENLGHEDNYNFFESCFVKHWSVKHWCGKFFHINFL